ncbi:MAG: GWxTD domain-containing protein [Saprospiraceae bacterium]|nr:GWxTD domain-containing protein [Saprospiraceae bacterium]
MKKLRLLWLLLLCGAACEGLALEASVSFSVFKAESKGYVEVYLHVAGPSVQFVPAADSATLQAGVEVLLYFKKDGEIARYDKFALHSPRLRMPGDFIDIKRYALPDGDYELTAELRDLNRPENEKTYRSDLSVRMTGEALLQSDIQLLAAAYQDTTDNPFCKNGLFMAPLGFHLYDRTASQLIFYHEIYHADIALNDDFLVSYRIEQPEDPTPRTVMIAHKRRSPAPVVPLLIQLDISRVPTGDYRLVVELRNREQELLGAKSISFRRENPFLRLDALDLSQINLDEEFVGELSAEELRYSLRALTPKLAGKEMEALNLIIKSDSLPAQRMYLFAHWVKQNPNAPEGAYRQYMKIVQAVDNTFISGFRRGFETDRGHVYLKYGPPDDMETREQEASASPYEVWSYYHFPVTRQNNVKFIFYNPSLAPGDFILLHSDAIGERQNPQWMRDLYRNAPAEWEGNAIDGNDIRDNFNRNVKRVLRDN